jgi:hypothetical protein
MAATAPGVQRNAETLFDGSLAARAAEMRLLLVADHLGRDLKLLFVDARAIR